MTLTLSRDRLIDEKSRSGFLKFNWSEITYFKISYWNVSIEFLDIIFRENQQLKNALKIHFVTNSKGSKLMQLFCNWLFFFCLILINAFLFTSVIFLFGILTAITHHLLYYFATRTYHHNITCQYHHKSNLFSNTLRTRRTKCRDVGASPSVIS